MKTPSIGTLAALCVVIAAALGAQQTTVDALKSAAANAQATADSTSASLEVLRLASDPWRSPPVVIAMISAISSCCLALISALVSIRNNGLAKSTAATVDKVHALTNSAMTATLGSYAKSLATIVDLLEIRYNENPTLELKVMLKTAEVRAAEAQAKFQEHGKAQEAIYAHEDRHNAPAVE